MASIILKPGREQSVLRRHPWIFSGAVQRTEGTPADGETIEIFDSNKNWHARGSYSSKSQISVRLLTYDESEAIDAEFWFRRLRRAVSQRWTPAMW